MRQSINAFYKAFLAFIANKNNPHQVKASQLDAYTKGEVSAMLVDKMKPGTLPISYFAVNSVLNYKGTPAYKFSTVSGEVILTMTFPDITKGNDFLTLSGYQFEVEESITVHPNAEATILEGDDVIVYVRLNAGSPYYYYVDYRTPAPVTPETTPICILKRLRDGISGTSFVERFNTIWIDGYGLGDDVVHGQMMLSTNDITDEEPDWVKDIKA